MPELNSGLLFVPSLTASWWLSLSGFHLVVKGLEERNYSPDDPPATLNKIETRGGSRLRSHAQ